MSRKKKIAFKLNPEWMFKEPLDFEYNKYTLLDYIQKCEKGFDKMEVYPDFVEISLHLANLQSIVKENTLLLTNKKFESCDDEILVKELIPKKPRELTEEEEKELNETIAKLVGYEGEIVWDTTRPDGQPKRFYDMTKFKETFGYVPNTTLEDGLKETIDWYSNNKETARL
jgi:hypothetical protein